ncbi:N-acetyltransferase family protein [Methylibium sp.]|uniref:GNAT family N-acetyltransferase n=1 Tax=Methylibium sp. TaxID=2067992 RepID=UPI003D0AEE70
MARGYKKFYGTPASDAEFEVAWNRLLAQDGVLGLGAKVNGELVGIAHYLFHTSTWATTICYLQDLFTADEECGKGVARALIARLGQCPCCGKVSTMLLARDGEVPFIRYTATCGRYRHQQ